MIQSSNASFSGVVEPVLGGLLVLLHMPVGLRYLSRWRRVRWGLSLVAIDNNRWRVCQLGCKVWGGCLLLIGHLSIARLPNPLLEVSEHDQHEDPTNDRDTIKGP